MPGRFRYGAYSGANHVAGFHTRSGSAIGGGGDPGLALLSQATLWLDASNPGSDSQVAQNLGTGGVPLNARYGSSTSPDTNDPLLLTHSGTNYLYLPGLTLNGCFTPDAVALRVTGDIDIQVRVAMDDWTPTGAQRVVTKRNDGATNFSYGFFVNTTGTLVFEFGNTPTTTLSATSSVATGFTDGAANWIRATRASATGTVTFFTAADSSSVPSSWTQLGTTVATTAGAINAGTERLYVGGFGAAGAAPTSSMAAGKFFRARVLDGILGTVVFDADYVANTAQSSFVESSSNAATVTINRALSGRKSVVVLDATWLFGTDDFFEIPDNALLDFAAAQDFTLCALVREHSTQTSSGRLVSKRNGAGGVGWILMNTATEGTIQIFQEHGGGSSTDTQDGFTMGVASLVSGVRSGINLIAYVGSTGTLTASSSNDLSNALVTRVGANPDSTSFLDAEIQTIAVFRSALTTTQLGQIATYFGV